MRRAQNAPLSSSPRLHVDERRRPTPSTTTQEDASGSEKTKDDTKQFYQEMVDTLKDMDVQPRPSRPARSTSGLMNNIRSAQSLVAPQRPGQEMRPLLKTPQASHHLHIYAHKHNTHIVLTRPNREPILSYSAGNIGFRKAQRGSFDAAFQLAAYVMRTISDKGLLRSTQFSEGSGARSLEAPIRDLEVVLRGFGKGREAVVKALLGTEGRYLREKITLVSDDTKLKFGGTRSQNPRRLG